MSEDMTDAGVGAGEDQMLDEEFAYRTPAENRDRFVFYIPETSFRDEMVRLGAIMGMVETSRYQRDYWQSCESAIHLGKFIYHRFDDEEMGELVNKLENAYYGDNFGSSWFDPINPTFSNISAPLEIPKLDKDADSKVPPLYFLFVRENISIQDNDFVLIRGYINQKGNLAYKIPLVAHEAYTKKAYNKCYDIVVQITAKASEYLNYRDYVAQLKNDIVANRKKLIKALQDEKKEAYKKGVELLGRENADDWGRDAHIFGVVNHETRTLPSHMQDHIKRWSYDPSNILNDGLAGSSFAHFGGRSDNNGKDGDDHSFAKLTHDSMYNLQIMASIAHDSAMNNESITMTFRKYAQIVRYIASGITQINMPSEKGDGGAIIEKFSWWTKAFPNAYQSILTRYLDIKYNLENNLLGSATQKEIGVYIEMSEMVEDVLERAHEWTRKSVEFILQRKENKSSKKKKGLGGLGGDDW